MSVLLQKWVEIFQDLYEMLQNNQIMLNDLQVVNAETTRFDIIVKGDSRELFLSIKCNPLRVEDIQRLNADCWLASPVIDEVPQEVLTEIKHIRGKKNFIMLDPQGYLRTVEDKGHVTLKQRLNLDLSGITAIKVDRQEIATLTGGLVGLAGMRALQLQGIKF